MKKYLIIGLVALGSLGLGANGFAQETKGSARATLGSTPTAGPRMNAFLVDKIIGSKVLNLQGDTLGKIADLVADVDTGRILYAILDFGGFLGFEEKRFPVPWGSLAALPSEGIFFLNQTKAQLENAPAFDRKQVPNMGDVQWGANVFKYYGAPAGYAQWGLPGYDYGYDEYHGSRYPIPAGSGINPASRTEDPYKTLFDAHTMKTISGHVIKIDQVPEFAYGLQMRVTVLTDKKEVLPVYLGPAFYVAGPWQAKHLTLGDQVTVSGSQVVVRGEPLLIAMTVTQGNAVLRLRDQEGIPEWIGWKTPSK
jgi:sporulation protein YlmC with PRC-barrel domain